MINLHPESVGLSSIQITFNEIDANTERVVRLQRSLKRMFFFISENHE